MDKGDPSGWSGKKQAIPHAETPPAAAIAPTPEAEQHLSPDMQDAIFQLQSTFRRHHMNVDQITLSKLSPVAAERSHTDPTPKPQVIIRDISFGEERLQALRYYPVQGQRLPAPLTDISALPSPRKRQRLSGSAFGRPDELLTQHVSTGYQLSTYGYVSSDLSRVHRTVSDPQSLTLLEPPPLSSTHRNQGTFWETVIGPSRATDSILPRPPSLDPRVSTLPTQPSVQLKPLHPPETIPPHDLQPGQRRRQDEPSLTPAEPSVSIARKDPVPPLKLERQAEVYRTVPMAAHLLPQISHSALPQAHPRRSARESEPAQARLPGMFPEQAESHRVPPQRFLISEKDLPPNPVRPPSTSRSEKPGESREKPSASKPKKVQPLFKCDECPSEFKRKSDRNRHVRVVHLKERPYICTDCHGAFGEKSNLYKHIRMVHQNIRAFKCEKCGFSFGQKGNLNTHMRQVHNIEMRTYKCKHCVSSFGTKRGLDKHVDEIHREETTAAADQASEGRSPSPPSGSGRSEVTGVPPVGRAGVTSRESPRSESYSARPSRQGEG